MSIKSLISQVSQYAPALGLALGGPAGGVVGALVSAAFGIDSNDPKKLIEKIAADPGAGLKLKQIEYQHAQFLAEINSKNYVTEVDDRKDARKNSPIFKNFLLWMAVLVTIGFFVTLFLLFFPQVQVSSDEKQLLAALVGVLISKWQTIIDFFYGSSHK